MVKDDGKPNQSALARLCGVKQSSIWSLLQGAIEKPRFLYQLANALRTSAQWLTTGEGPEEMDGSASRDAMPSQLQDTIPILGKAHATKYGAAVYIDTNEGDEIGRAPRHPALERVATAFAVYTEGDSMAPRFKPGELAYVAGFIPPMKGQDCLVELKTGDAYLKEYLHRDDAEVVCWQYNPEQEWRCPVEEVAQIHKVVR